LASKVDASFARNLQPLSPRFRGRPLAIANEPLCFHISCCLPHMDKKFDVNKPLLLWCSSHGTLAAEEIPLFLEAGFRVVPLLTEFWGFTLDEKLDEILCPDWKESVGLPANVVAQLQRLQICRNEGRDALRLEDLDLLNRYVDVVYVTVLPALAVALSQVFHGTVIFRPFGHGQLNTYTRIATGFGADLAVLADANNFVWCPILTTLQEIEDPRLYRNPQLVSGFVSRSRLGPSQWMADQSDPFVVETIPRIETQLYYAETYKNYLADFGDLPLRILGGNSPGGGGGLNDARIIGRLNDEEYYREACRARLSIYHGRSRYHVHYHPVEFMYLGIPVLFHKDCAIAVEAVRSGLDPAQLPEYGMYATIAEARERARHALVNVENAKALSLKQRFFSECVFDRTKALVQARWLRSLCVTINQARENARIAQTREAAAVTLFPGVPATDAVPKKPKRHWSVRTARELRRVCERITRRTRQSG
jgi:hypothetical protein